MSIADVAQQLLYLLEQLTLFANVEGANLLELDAKGIAEDVDRILV